MHVLVVDDSAEVRSRLVETLAGVDGVVSVASAASVGEAERSVIAQAPDVAVLDVRLPDGSGLQLLRLIRAARLKSVVIMLTNYVELQMRDACLEGGADYFLDKSREFDLVAHVVARHARSGS